VTPMKDIYKGMLTRYRNFRPALSKNVSFFLPPDSTVYPCILLSYKVQCVTPTQFPFQNILCSWPAYTVTLIQSSPKWFTAIAEPGMTWNDDTGIL
jgi:hypothetical protein